MVSKTNTTEKAAACKSYADNAKCMLGAGCWPTYTIKGVNSADSDQSYKPKYMCMGDAGLGNSSGQAVNDLGCPATTCDSGSMATPMVSLFAVIAAMLYQLM